MRRPTASSSKQDRVLPRILRRSTRFEATPEDAVKVIDKTPVEETPPIITDIKINKEVEIETVPETSTMKDTQVIASSTKPKMSSFQTGGQPVKIRRYCCPRCSYSTDRRDLFTRHENIHRDEKPFRCYVCNKMFNRADHVKKHFLRIHKGVDYDAKLTKRIKGIDYETDESYHFEPLDKTLQNLNTTPAPLQDINGNNLKSSAGVLKTNSISDSPDKISHQQNVPVSHSSLLNGSRPTLLSSELMSRILEGNHLLSKQSVQNIAAIMNPSLQVSNHVTNTVSSMSSTSALFGSSASNLSALFPLDSGTQRSKPLFITGTDLTKWPKMQEVLPSGNNATTMNSGKTSTNDYSARQRTTHIQEEIISSDESESMDESSSSTSSLGPTLTKKSAVAFIPRHSVTKVTTSLPVVPSTVVRTKPRKGKIVQNLEPSMEVTDDSVFDCEFCGCSFVDFPSLHTHRFLLHQHVSEPEQALPYECCLCHKRFPIQRSVISHMNSHSSLNERIRKRKKAALKKVESFSIVNQNQNQQSDVPEVSQLLLESSSRRKQFIPRKLVKSDEEDGNE